MAVPSLAGVTPLKPANPLLSSFDMFCKEIYSKKNVGFLRYFFSKTRKYSRYYRAKAINM